MNSSTKIFLDGAERQVMSKWNPEPIVQGFTTNPTLMRKAGITDYRAFAKDLLAEIRVKPVSFEVFADDFSEMKRQAREIASWADNVYVKIPVTNSEGVPSYTLVRELTQLGIKLNVTAVFTPEQSFAVCEALRGGAPAIVSVFAGRIADSGRDPMPILRAAVEMARWAGPQVEVLWASPREALNIVQAGEYGCHIITVTADLLAKTKCFGMDLGQFSLDTVRMFKRDAEAAGFLL